jgi:hypothetical protein
MSTPSWVREPPRVSVVAKSERECHSGAERKIDYVKAAGSSIHPSFKNSSKDIIVSDKNVQGSSEGPQQFPFTFFTVASLQQHTNSFSDQNLIRETCFGITYLADHHGSKVTVPAKNTSSDDMWPVSSVLIVTFSVLSSFQC